MIPIILNLRHIIYGYIISQRFDIKKPFITAFGLTDEVFAISVNTNGREKFIWGLELGAYLSWIIGTLVGVIFGAFLISNRILAKSLVFSLTALFLILLIPNLRGYNALSALIGGLIALVFHYFGYTSVGILLAGVLSPVLILKVRGGRNG